MHTHAHTHLRHPLIGDGGSEEYVWCLFNKRYPKQKHPAGLEMGRVKTAFSCDWQEVNHAFRSVFSCFYVVHEGQFYCDFEFSLGFTVYS